MNGIHEVVGSIPIGSTIPLADTAPAQRPGLLHIGDEQRMVADVRRSGEPAGHT